ncbi:hypothetical protein [Paenibacillus marinisediminis]
MKKHTQFLFTILLFILIGTFALPWSYLLIYGYFTDFIIAKVIGVGILVAYLWLFIKTIPYKMSWPVVVLIVLLALALVVIAALVLPSGNGFMEN